MRGIVWLRRDLRLHDNVALFEASSRCDEVVLCFVLDPVFLRSERVGAPIVQAFFGAISSLRYNLRAAGSDLALFEGDAARELGAFAKRIRADAVFYNEDYEPFALERDAAVTRALRDDGVAVYSSLDHVYFGADEVEQQNGDPYRVFTPYRKRWLDRRRLAPSAPVPSERMLRAKAMQADAIGETRSVPYPEEYGHHTSPNYPTVNEGVAREMLSSFLESGGAVERYREERNIPSIEGTSRLSPQLRAGTLGIRECIERAFARLDESHGDAGDNIEAWIGELIWRDFYQMVLRRYPHVAERAFLENGERVAWRDADAEFAAWCAGETGYPIIDAAMRQLNTTGWMHNRLRMIVASFLTKHLLIDWRRGERYFEQRLADADLAQNNGGWQWAASTGTDAAPYFRIFNPVRQGQLFDEDGAFVRSMIPELRNVSNAVVHEPWKMASPPRDYPSPIVPLEIARARAVNVFAGAFRK